MQLDNSEVEETDDKGSSASETTGENSSAGDSKHSNEYAYEQVPASPPDSSTARLDAATRRRNRVARANPWVPFRQSRRQKLSGFYNDQYRILFNEVVTEATNFQDPEKYKSIHPSQIGVSTWSSEEKEVFFQALTKYGQDNIRAISKAIISKSEMEVREYFLLLQDNFIERQINDPQLNHAIGLRDIPAAVELGEDCRKRLSTAADALAWHQENFEGKEELKAHGDYWLLDEELGIRIQDIVSAELEREKDPIGKEEAETAEHEAGPPIKEEEARQKPSYPSSEDASMVEIDSTQGTIDPSLLSSIPAARLLNLRKCLQLSRRVFMNSRRRSRSWLKLAALDEEPSIYYTAFEDLHRLVVSVTRKLVQAALFQSLSRARALDRKNRHIDKIPRVEKCDVQNAISILGMPRNSREYWVKVPRRNLNFVYDTVRKTRMKYDDIEVELRKPIFRKGSKKYLKEMRDREEYQKGEGTRGDEEAQENEETEEAERNWESYESRRARKAVDELSEQDTSSSGSGSVTPDDTNIGPWYVIRQKRRRKQLENDQLDEAEREDQLATFLEERRICAMLGEDVPNDEKEEKKYKRIDRERKEQGQLVDWRSWIDYHAEWEGSNDRKEEDTPEFEERPTKRSRLTQLDHAESNDSDNFAGVWYPQVKLERQGVASPGITDPSVLGNNMKSEALGEYLDDAEGPSGIDEENLLESTEADSDGMAVSAADDHENYPKFADAGSENASNVHMQSYEGYPESTEAGWNNPTSLPTNNHGSISGSMNQPSLNSGMSHDNQEDFSSSSDSATSLKRPRRRVPLPPGANLDLTFGIGTEEAPIDVDSGTNADEEDDSDEDSSSDLDEDSSGDSDVEMFGRH